MLKIRRIHFANAGYEEATFDGEALEFRDPDSGQPAHCVLHAENGTGKTTVLGLVFNIPVPKEARFLPHLVKPDYQFADYFPRGVGVIAIEWHDPAGRHPVTVQFVVPQLRGSERQTWRRWALFRSGPGLLFDDLPLKGLRGRHRTAFAGRDDVAAWLRDHEERFADSHDFEVAATQDTWRTMLERHGVDTHLMDSQLEFNRQEGGLDSFLKIPTEQEFIARFLALCLVAPDHGLDAMAEPVCAQVRTIVGRMQGYDKLVAKRALLSDLAQAFRPFTAAAREWQVRKQETTRAETRAAAVKQAAEQRADALDAEAAEAEQTAQDLLQRQAALRAEAAQAELTGAAARLALVDLRAHVAAEAHAAAAARATGAWQRSAGLAAARDLRDVLAIETEVARFEQAMAEAEREAVEPRRRAHAAGAQLWQLLGRVLAAEQEAVAHETSALKAAEAERTQVLAERRRLADQTIAAQREDATLAAQIRMADAAFADLHRDGIVQLGESIATCLARLERERQQAEGAARDAAARADRHETAAEAALREAGEAEAERREATVKAEAARQSADKAENTRGDLLRGDIWQTHLGPAQAFGPEAAVTAQQQARDQSLAAQRARARAALMRDDADRIARHRVAAVDSNVDLVLARLSELGLHSAIAAATWLADIVADVDRLRTFAAVNPAAFAGVFVQDPAELARIPALDFSGLTIDRPVAILSPCEQPGEAAALAVVPDRPEAYDITAAEGLVEDLGTKVSAAEMEAETACFTADALTGLKTAVEAWLAEWGSRQAGGNPPAYRRPGRRSAGCRRPRRGSTQARGNRAACRPDDSADGPAASGQSRRRGTRQAGRRQMAAAIRRSCRSVAPPAHAPGGAPRCTRQPGSSRPGSGRSRADTR
ncbi:MAG: hypothetical protein JO122_00195 [Acetobacteraceae bacterium]|nr:hypothetical protein [Acetobacteraceae bacterium]